MVGEDDDSGSHAPSPLPAGSGRKTFWRSASWSASRSTPQANSHFDHGKDCSDAATEKDGGPGAPIRRYAVPLTPRSQHNSKARSCLPPLQPLAIARRSLVEWPKAGSDDVGEWPQPSTPSGRAELSRPGEGLRLDLSSFQKNADSATGPALVRRDKIAFFDKECSKVAEHIYLGGDAVARNRDILKENGITHVLNCVGFVCPEYFKSDFVYKTLWLQDSPSEDITSILYDVFDYFEDVRDQNGRVLVHCCQGVSRSTSLVIAYLMWREGQSFDDAFQYVKAARGIANPNMGFACQLLQCQKRVHAIPLSPSSVLRMYRMAPHSPYDPLHLVPKMVNDPSPLALDSRGAFIVHVPSAIYVWIGKSCEAVMERDAKAAAFQVVRYERVQGPIITVGESEEPSEFWDAFMSGPVPVDQEKVELAKKIEVGKKKVDSYDVDFEPFLKAIAGGFVPPFSQSGAGHETHLPARESNWSILRRKFVTGSVKDWVTASRALSRVCSDSMLIVDANSRASKNQLLSAVDSSSPPYLSPSSLSSDSSNSSKSNSNSPSVSPSTGSSSPAPSPASSNLSKQLPPSSKFSRPVSNDRDPSATFKQSLKPFSKTVSLPAKGLALSLAERRGSLSPSLKLSNTNVFPVSLVSPQGGIWREGGLYTSDDSVFHMPRNKEHCFDCEKPKPNPIQEKPCGACLGESVVNNLCTGKRNSDETCGVGKTCPSKGLESSVTGLIDSVVEYSKPTHLVVYSWPNLEKVVEFGIGDLDSKAAFLFLAPGTGLSKHKVGMLYLWIGTCVGDGGRSSQMDSGRGIGEVKDEVDWNQVGSDFLAVMGLPKEIPIKVVKEKEEPDEFLQLLKKL